MYVELSWMLAVAHIWTWELMYCCPDNDISGSSFLSCIKLPCKHLPNVLEMIHIGYMYFDIQFFFKGRIVLSLV